MVENINNNGSFLTEEYITKSANFADLDSDYVRELIKLSKFIQNDNKTLKTINEQYHLLYTLNEQLSNNFDLPKQIKEKEYTYNLILALAGVSLLFDKNKSLGISEQVTIDSLSSIKIWCDHFKKEENVCGVSVDILNWLMKNLRGELFRLGRLEFCLTNFVNEIQVYQNYKTKQLAILANDGYEVSKDGRFFLDDIMNESDVWITKLETVNNYVIGNPVRNFVCNEIVKLNLREWELIIKANDTMLDVHIPAGETMRLEECQDSFKQATKFFKTYFSQKKYKGFQCLAWFLDPNYQKLLFKTSNIIKFQKEFNLFPINYNSNSEVFSRLFGGKQFEDIKSEELKSYLQINAYFFLKDGGMLNGGGGFIFKQN